MNKFRKFVLEDIAQQQKLSVEELNFDNLEVEVSINEGSGYMGYPTLEIDVTGRVTTVSNPDPDIYIFVLRTYTRRELGDLLDETLTEVLNS